MDKQALRAHALAKRAALPAVDPSDLIAPILAFLARFGPKPPCWVAGYDPIGAEIDPRAALVALRARGYGLVLPQTPRRGLPLLFRAHAPDTALVAGRFGTRHPIGPVHDPALLLVPLLAFDRVGNRLGYGAGYYDRSLAALPNAVAIGLAYADQEVAQVPTEPHDVQLAAIATERGLILTRPPGLEP